MSLMDEKHNEVENDTIEYIDIEEILNDTDENNIAEEATAGKSKSWKKFLNKRNGIAAGIMAAVIISITVAAFIFSPKKDKTVAVVENTQTSTETVIDLTEAATEVQEMPLLGMKLETVADETSITARVFGEDGNQIGGQEFVINLFEGTIDDNKEAVDYIKNQNNLVDKKKNNEETISASEETTSQNESMEVPESVTDSKVYKDDDMDGTVYIGDLQAGTYTLTVVCAGDGFETPDAVETTVVKYEIIEDIMDKVVEQNEETEKEDPQNNREQGPVSDTPVELPSETPDDEGNKKTITVENIVTDNGNYVYTAQQLETLQLIESDVQKYEQTTVAIKNEDGQISYIIGYIHSKGVVTVETGEEEVIEQLLVEKDKLTVKTARNIYTLMKTAQTQSSKTETTVPSETATESESTDAAKEYVLLKTDVVIKSETREVYDGWYTSNGITNFLVDGVPYTGWHLINGINYYFDAKGALSSKVVIDVSTFNGEIDWAAVKESGIDYAIIRVGYRGWGSGTLVLDNRFDENMSGAISAGIQVGAYIVTQAVNTNEAVEEASFIIQKCRGYNVSLPLVIDVEAAGGADGEGRGDLISVGERTAVVNAFATTIRNAGYTPMVYASMNWLNNYLNASSIMPECQVWVAQYRDVDETDYSGRYNMWQFRSDGRINGIGGNVDMNAWKN